MDDSIAMSLFKELMSGGISEGVYDVLTKTPKNFAGGTPWTIVENFYNNVIMPLALGVIVIYFMIAMIEKLSSEHFDWDHMIKIFAILAGSWYLIQNAFPIMETMFQIGANLITSLENAASAAGSNGISSPSISASIKEALWKNLTGNDGLEDVGMLDSIWITIKLFPYWLCSRVLGWCAMFICYSRLIEILLRTMFAPIALSDCFHRGLDGAGARFLKNYFAISIQGAVIYAVMSIYSIVSVSVLSNTDQNFGSYMGVMLVLSFAAVGVLFRSLSLTKELVGTA